MYIIKCNLIKLIIKSCINYDLLVNNYVTDIDVVLLLSLHTYKNYLVNK